LTKAYKNLFPDTTSVSIPAVTTKGHCLFVNSSPNITFRIALAVYSFLISTICAIFSVIDSLFETFLDMANI
jgi:hypothetical protein